MMTVQVSSAGGKWKRRGLGLLLWQIIDEGEAMASVDSSGVSLEANHLAPYYILTCLFIGHLCQ